MTLNLTKDGNIKVPIFSINLFYECFYNLVIQKDSISHEENKNYLKLKINIKCKWIQYSITGTSTKCNHIVISCLKDWQQF